MKMQILFYFSYGAVSGERYEYLVLAKCAFRLFPALLLLCPIKKIDKSILPYLKWNDGISQWLFSLCSLYTPLLSKDKPLLSFFFYFLTVNSYKRKISNCEFCNLSGFWWKTFPELVANWWAATAAGKKLCANQFGQTNNFWYVYMSVINKNCMRNLLQTQQHSDKTKAELRQEKKLKRKLSENLNVENRLNWLLLVPCGFSGFFSQY